MPTIKDVAKEAGVSIATVSYVLNDKFDMVSEDTRQQVLTTARRSGTAFASAKPCRWSALTACPSVKLSARR